MGRPGGGAVGTVAVWLSYVVGVGALLVAAVALWTVDDSCPQWEDEGSMAAPHSPYSLVMCAPASPPFTWSVVLGVALSTAVAVLARRRWRTRAGIGVLALTSVGLLLAPVLLLGLLHGSLPQDCLTGRTQAGDCSRDRETR